MSLCLNCVVSSLIAHEFVYEQFFCLGLACLLNEPKTNAQVWLIYKQTSMNKLFIKSSSSCSWSTWFIYSPRSKVGYWWDIWLCGPSMNMSCDVACSKADEIVSILFYFICVERLHLLMQFGWFVLQGIYMKFLDLWNAKQEKKNVLKKIITQDNIYVVWQFSYIHEVAIILLVRGEKKYAAILFSF